VVVACRTKVETGAGFATTAGSGDFDGGGGRQGCGGWAVVTEGSVGLGASAAFLGRRGGVARLGSAELAAVNAEGSGLVAFVVVFFVMIFSRFLLAAHSLGNATFFNITQLG